MRRQTFCFCSMVKLMKASICVLEKITDTYTSVNILEQHTRNKPSSVNNLYQKETF